MFICIFCVYIYIYIYIYTYVKYYSLSFSLSLYIYIYIINKLPSKRSFMGPGDLDRGLGSLTAP